jgi:hypothetical protein
MNGPNKLSKHKRSRLLGPFVGYEENEVLQIQPLVFKAFSPVFVALEIHLRVQLQGAFLHCDFVSAPENALVFTAF